MGAKSSKVFIYVANSAQEPLETSTLTAPTNWTGKLANLTRMDRLIAEQAIAQRLSSFAFAQDNLDLLLLISLCVPNGRITMDASSHLADHPPQRMSPDELASTTHAVIGGFTATQHFLGNHIFNWPAGDSDGAQKAHVTSSVIAYHCIQAEEGGPVESVTARAYWHSELERQTDRGVEISGVRG